MAIWGMRFAGWISKATDTLSEYVTITDFSTSIVVSSKRLNVTYVVGTLPVLLHQLKTILYSGTFMY
jgi:hypothetical protein